MERRRSTRSVKGRYGLCVDHTQTINYTGLSVDGRQNCVITCYTRAISERFRDASWYINLRLICLLETTDIKDWRNGLADVLATNVDGRRILNMMQWINCKPGSLTVS